MTNIHPEGKAKTWYQVLFFVGIVLLIIALSLGIPSVNRSQKMSSYTGVGQAEILKQSSESHVSRSKGYHVQYHFDVRITAGNETFLSTQTRSSATGWKTGDILPVVYNLNNPEDFVLDTTPEAYARRQSSLERIAGILLISALLCLLAGYWFRRSYDQTKEAP